jgi:hypothetical protein
VDPSPGSRQLSLLDARQTWDLSAVNALLGLPGIDPRAADVERLAELLYRLAFVEQIQNASPKLL